MSSPFQPPPGFIHLVLKHPFYLEIPTHIVSTLCLLPLKYLRYIGWCVLGADGILTDEQGLEIALNGDLLDRGVYHYAVPGDDVFAHAVDLEVIKQRSQYTSQSSGTRNNFAQKLLERDGRCVWSGAEWGVGMHIIPHARGSEWLQCIIDNRPHDEDIDDISIDDIENGIYAASDIHNHCFDPRRVVVLKTPNPILEMTDVPARYQRNLLMNVSYPTDSRYTLQWIVQPGEGMLNRVPNNNDAAFLNQRPAKPVDLLLHYMYGGAVVKQWGKNTDVLNMRPNIPRPPPPAKVPTMGPPKSVHNRQIAIEKWFGTAPALDAGGASEGAADSEAQERWDEDDVMLFLWGNSKVATERHARKERERTARLEDWRTAVTGDPIIASTISHKVFLYAPYKNSSENSNTGYNPKPNT